MTNKRNELYFGDNLDVMTSKEFTKYQNNIDFIYIDPPYNTQTRKSYDDATQSEEWASFMIQRLTMAERLLKDDGVIFISIDDNEYANLKNVCDIVFTKKNFIGTFITHQAQRSNAKLINTVHEYILAYAKNKNKIKEFSIKRIEIPEQKTLINSLQSKILKIFKTEGREKAEKDLQKEIKEISYNQNIKWIRNYNKVDEDGNIYFAIDLSTPSEPREVHIDEINLHLPALETRGWISNDKFIELYNKNRLSFRNGRPYKKKLLVEAEDSVPSILDFYSRQGTEDLKRLGLNGLFDTPKPVDMIKFLIRITNQRNSTILDFFGGSGTTAQAVYETNNEDDRNNNYILIQLEEEVKNKKQKETCIKHDIKPVISEILKLRIDTYLKKNKIKDDYVVFSEVRH